MPTFVTDEVVSATKLNNATARDWASWTPTLTNLTLGSGTVTARYCQLGSETVFAYFGFVLGAGSAVGTGPTFSLPVTAASYPANHIVGQARYTDASGPDWVGTVVLSSTTVAGMNYIDGASQIAAVTATIPFTWVSTDSLFCQFFYEVA